jgi:hypothetical protein
MAEFGIEYTDDGGIRVIRVPPSYQSDNQFLAGLPIVGTPEDDDIIQFDENAPEWELNQPQSIGGGQQYTSADFDSDFASKTTDDLTEGAANLYFSDTLVANNPDVSANTAARHTQGTDQGTDNQTFEIDTGASSSVLLKNDNGELQVRRGDDVTFADLRIENLVVEGDTSIVKTETVEIDDNIFELNSNVTGNPSENGGMEINRGSEANASFVWNENGNYWQAGTKGSEAEIAKAGDDLSSFNNDLDSDDIPEGASNLYYTQSRFDSDFSAKNTDDLSEGSQNLYFTEARAKSAAFASASGNQGIVLDFDMQAGTADITLDNLNSFSTDDLSEGSNLYYTDERAQDATADLIEAGSGITVSYDDPADNLTINAATADPEVIQDEAWSVLSGTQTLIDITYNDAADDVSFEVEPDLSQYDNTTSGFISGLSSFTTDDLAEGSANLYYEDEKVDDRVNDLLFAGSNIDLSYDDINNTLTISANDDTNTPEEIQDAAWDVLGGTQSLISVIYDDTSDEVDFLVDGDLSNYDNSTSGFISDLSTFTTDDLTEGLNNLYYTQARFDSDFSAKTTDDLSEGSTNLYFTDSRAVTAVEDELTLELNEIQASAPSTFQDDLTVSGNLTVNGDSFQSNTQIVTSEDNQIFLNAGETGTGISHSTAGFALDRGSAEPFVTLFVEGDDEFKLGKYYIELEYSGLTGTFQFNEKITGQSSGATANVFEDTGSKLRLKNITNDFTAGETVEGTTSTATATIDNITEISQIFPSLLRESTPTDGGIHYYDSATKLAVTDSGFTFDGTTLSVPDLSVSGAISGINTDNLTEGTSNLFFTDERAQDAVAAALVGGDGLSVTYDDGANEITLDTSDHSILDGGTEIVADPASVNFGSNLSVTDDGGGAVTIDGTDTQLSAEEVQDFAFGTTLSGIQSLITVSYDDANGELDFAVESDLSQYDNSTSGFVSNLTSFTTDDLTEGSNLYYTDERVEDRVATVLSGGANTTVAHDDGNDTITISSTDTQLSDSEAQDAVFPAVLGGTQSLISVTYNGTTNDLSFAVDDDLSNYDNSNSGFLTGISSFTTDDLTEGTDNLYYLDSRVNSLISGGSGVATTFTQNDPQGGDLEFNISLTPFDTDDLSEGSGNLYFTDARAVSAVEAANPLTLSGATTINNTFQLENGTSVNDIKTTVDSNSDNALVTEGALTTYVGNQVATTEEIQDDAWGVLTGTQDLITVTYDDPNGEVDFEVEPNLSNYTNDAGFLTGISSFTTDDLTEGTSSLYFTDERAQDAVDSLLAEGTNITLTYDDAGDSLTIDATNTQRSDEEIQDAVYNNVLSGAQSLITVSYDDANNEVDYEVESNLSNYTNDQGWTAYGSSDFDTDFGTKTTDDLAEGSGNLYFTDSRATAALENAATVNFSGDVGLANGTSVNNIKTSVTGTSDNAVLTEGAVVAEINNQTGSTNPDTVMQGSNLTLSDSDSNTVFIVTTSITVTLPTGLSEGFNAVFINEGGGTVTFNASAGTTLSAPFGENTLEIENAQAPLVADGSDNFYLGGQLGA